MTTNRDYQNTYPKGFFEFFSQSHDIDIEEPDDPLPKVLYFEDATATFSSFTEEPKVIKF